MVVCNVTREIIKQRRADNSGKVRISIIFT